MRTTITIDDAVFSELMRLTSAKTRSGAIHKALTEWIRRKKIEKLKALRGKLDLTENLDELRQLVIDEADSLHGLCGMVACDEGSWR